MTQKTLEALRRGDLAGARELRLPGLDEFPREIFGLAETLEILDLSDGRLESLPEDMSRLRKLRVLFCSGNRFRRLPPALGDCGALRMIGFRRVGLREVPGESLPPQLRWLTLTDNEIEGLPAELGERPQLQKLMLAGNRLASLPSTLRNAEKLELIRLSSNRFDSLPSWLSALPALAWISWGANACEREIAAPAPAPASFSQLDIGALLGEGASGRVHRATWRREGEAARSVAVKIFKGAITSDGLPAREMAASLTAGDHPNLTAALGRLSDHPDGAQAMLMPLLPPHWRRLAGPPDFESCSRDVYDPALRLSTEAGLSLLHGVATAVAHLHARGLMHGDLYAHNILWDGVAGEAALGDFGAACSLPLGPEGDAWRRIESRAFGVLLEEVLARCPPESAAIQKLRDLARACLGKEARERPLLTEAAREIQAAGHGSA
ncbi:MAG: protein kinase [Hyphomicrobiales bacterium]|nr:MAG: protein kinase [Hyphomicrobiales bacterium]